MTDMTDMTDKGRHTIRFAASLGTMFDRHLGRWHQTPPDTITKRTPARRYSASKKLQFHACKGLNKKTPGQKTDVECHEPVLE